jgi:hypothetical protein
VASHLASGKASSQKKSRVSWSSLSRLPPTFWRYLYSVLSSGKTRREDQADLLSTQYLAHQKYLVQQKYLVHPPKSIWLTKVFPHKIYLLGSRDHKTWCLGSNRSFQHCHQKTSIEYLRHPPFDGLIATKQTISQMFAIYSVPYGQPQNKGNYLFEVL